MYVDHIHGPDCPYPEICEAAMDDPFVRRLHVPAPLTVEGRCHDLLVVTGDAAAGFLGDWQARDAYLRRRHQQRQNARQSMWN